MVKLFCAVVGAAGNAFPVDIDASQSVGDLQKAIKVELEYDSAAIKLQLYLAKNGATWLTENEVNGVSDTSGLTHLDAGRAKLWRVGLSDEDMVEVDEEGEAAGNGPVNVLVVAPTERRGAFDPFPAQEHLTRFPRWFRQRSEGSICVSRMQDRCI